METYSIKKEFKKNSNTTLVKVKLSKENNIKLIKNYSNTTLVKVKLV